MAGKKTKKATKKVIKVEPTNDEQKVKEMKEMDTVPLIDNNPRPISGATTWIMFAITLFFVTITITLLYSLSGQIRDLNARFELSGQHFNTVTADLKNSIGLYAASTSQSPFCAAYDQNGQTVFWVDSRKVTTSCAWVNVTK